MADLVIGLSKSVVEGALTKVQSAIEEDAKHRQKAQRDLVSITLEFEMMQSFLDVAKEESITNNMVRTWVKHVRDLAYDVEDCVEFVVHLDNTPDWWRRLLPSCMAPPLPLDQAVLQLEELKRRVEDVNNCYRRYSIINDSGSSSKPLVMLQQQASGAAIVDTTAINMIAEARAAAKRQRGLCDLAKLVMNEDGDNDNDLQVIAMWGTGGDLGRTSSVIWKAYNEKQICSTFTCRAWVKLMHPFNPREFIQSLTADFYATTYPEQQGEVIASDVLLSMKAEHTKEFLQQLNTKRYLIVLEDLSSMAEWRAIRTFFPNMKNGSCIIVSMQQFVVASLCIGRPYQLLELEQFSADHSVYAFIKKGSQCEGDKSEKTGDKKKAAEDWMMEHPLVGRDSEMNDLRQYTEKARLFSFQVLSVWGIAGVGKSALIKNLLCDRILNDCSLREKNKHRIIHKYAWVDVSYPFNLRDFSRSLLLNFRSQSLQANKDHDIDTVGSKNPILECRGILKRYWCFVVIDGLRSTKEWDFIQAEILPLKQASLSSGSSRNCIIIITTEASVAKHCRGNIGELVYNVKGLQADDAFDLFKKEVSPNLSNEAAQLRELISKCGGLPKVIVDIARSLPTRNKSLMEGARSINDNFMHVLENNREFCSLDGLFTWMHSYFRTCPDSLKLCIFYLSIFTGDCIIRRRRLVRRWIAEGYSRDNHEESVEHNGEKQFSDLLDLSIIQRSQQKTAIGDTRVVLCQVNSFIREYIVKQRMEENLVFELGDRSSGLTSQSAGRHLVISRRWVRERIVFESIDFSRLRSLTVFGEWESFLVSKSMKLLRVLDLEDAYRSVEYEDLEKMVKLLRRLKFLSLREHHEINRLPSSLDHLRQLQTLDVRGTSIVILPESITKLQKLQYIRAGTTEVPVSAPPPPVSSSWFCRRHRLVGVVVPRGIGKLTALYTLGVVNVAATGSKTFVKDLKKLTQLRKLGVSGINRKNSKEFFSAIKGHVHLESLSVQLDKETQGCCFRNGSNQDYLDGMISLRLENLRSLKLYGLNDKLPMWESSQLSKLQKLDLEMATLIENNTMKFLGKLPQLCIFLVKQVQDGELQFHVLGIALETPSFEKIKVLQIACGGSSSILHVTFGSITMVELELLKVDCYGGSPSYEFSGLQNLRGLKQVLLLDGSNAQALKEQLKSQLAEHQNKPLVIEEPPRSS